MADETKTIKLLQCGYKTQYRVENCKARATITNELLERWLTRGVITKRFDINGSPTWGTLNELAVHAGSRMSVDLFATTAERWFVSLVVRTGSKEMSTTRAGCALRRGTQLHVYGVLKNTKPGEQIIPQSEREVFERLDVPYREPAER